jgi:hypothetical protein
VTGSIVLRTGTGSLIAAHGDDQVSFETDVTGSDDGARGDPTAKQGLKPHAVGTSGHDGASGPGGRLANARKQRRTVNQGPALSRRLTMRRNSSRTLLAAVSAALAAVLLIAGGLLLWGSAYVHNTVQGQLSAQQITFPPAAAFAHPKAGSEITPNMIPSVSQYAGQQLLTGQQAEAYADHFIAQHLLPAVG